MDDTVKMVGGVVVVVLVGFIVRGMAADDTPPEVRACELAVESLENAARAEGTDTCREIDSVRTIAERDVSASSAGDVADSLRFYVDRPPYGCRSLSVEMSVASAIERAAADCSAAARADARE